MAEDTSTPTTAGMYDVWLGGNHHSVTERETADRLRAALPEIAEIAWANRAFHQRTARFMVRQGIRQFIDLGAGLPTQENTHQIVRRRAPDARVVYVDRDPRTVRLGRELIEGEPYVRFVHADVRDTDSVLHSDEVSELIDFTAPVGLLASALFHFISDKDDPWGVAKAYIDVLASGSYVAISHATADKQPSKPAQAAASTYSTTDAMMYLRNRDQVEWLFEGLKFVEPYVGGVPKLHYLGTWFCEDPDLAEEDSDRWCYAGVARKP